MPTRTRLRLVGLLIAAAITIALLLAWRANVRDRAQLAADLAAAKQALAQAAARQHDRDAQLAQSLAAFAAEKRSVTTPAQIVRDLPRKIPLPAPITLRSPGAADQTDKSHPVARADKPEGLDPTRPGNNASSSSNTAVSQAVIPEEDLKPLYDFAVDCRACQAKLAAAQGDLADERAKTTVLTHERDEAVRVAKGGSALRRVARAAKWLAIGAVAGAIAARAAH